MSNTRPPAKFTFDDFARAVLKAIGVDWTGDVAPSLSLYEELALDSLQAFHLLVVVEELAEVLYPPEVIPELFTLGQAYNYYRDLSSGDQTWEALLRADGSVDLSE